MVGRVSGLCPTMFLWFKAVSDGLFDKIAVNFGKLVGMA